MLEFMVIGILAAGLILLYVLINRQDLAGRLLIRRPRNDKKKRCRFYLERFGEQKESNLNRNIIVQALPWLGVLALVFILGNQYFVFATVLSGSMEPTLKKGDLVLAQTFDKEVKVGDVVMFAAKDFKEPVTHRVVGITAEGNIITKGDANTAVDTVTGTQPKLIVGKVVTIGNSYIILKGWGYYIRPENIGEQQSLTKLPGIFVAAKAFEQFRDLQPLIIFFATIFYFFVLIESHTERKRRTGKDSENRTKAR